MWGLVQAYRRGLFGFAFPPRTQMLEEFFRPLHYGPGAGKELVSIGHGCAGFLDRLSGSFGQSSITGRSPYYHAVIRLRLRCRKSAVLNVSGGFGRELWSGSLDKRVKAITEGLGLSGEHLLEFD